MTLAISTRVAAAPGDRPAAAANGAPAAPEERLRRDTIDLWHADLDAGAAADERLLSADERLRARRIQRAPVRDRWVRSRALLRTLLGGYLQREPAELRFELGAHGKPALAGEPAGGLRFNLSHSRGRMLLAVALGRELGVDIECSRQGRTGEFLRSWTEREAALKCVGTGLGDAGRGELQPAAGAAGASPTAPKAPTSGLWIAQLEVGSGAYAALAAQGVQEPRLRCFEFAG